METRKLIYGNLGEEGVRSRAENAKPRKEKQAQNDVNKQEEELMNE